MQTEKHKYLDEFLKAPLKPEDIKKIKDDEESLLESDQFSGYISFGTGGMRQVVELGTNRLNEYNIAKLSLSIARTIQKDHSSSQKPLIIVGYDSRLTSQGFSYMIYHLFKSLGLAVKIFKRPTPTPLVSFAIRELKAQAGVILTASHNPPEYNGYKLMGENGAQIISPQDEEIQKEFIHYPYEDIPREIHDWRETPPDTQDIMEEEIISSYVSRLKGEDFVNDEKKNISILYSALHGTGGWAFKRTFSELGYENFSILEEQSRPDGHFPSVKSPNPEEPSAFEMLIKKGKESGAQLLIATDPDADRIGCCVLKNGEYQFLTGNQIGCLILKSIAQRASKSVSNPYICKTIVTTELQRRVAQHYGIRVIETLTGFKYIASVLEKDPENYLFGGEESFGYLPIHWVRDKDSISSGIALAELANQKDLLQELDNIYISHGLYQEALYNIKLDQQSLPILERLKTAFLEHDSFIGKKFNGREVIDYINLNHKLIDHGCRPVTPEGKKLYESLPAANVLQVWLQPEGRITIRPSGTEPKIKVYVSMKYEEEILSQDNIDHAKKVLADKIKAVSQEFLAFLNIK